MSRLRLALLLTIFSGFFWSREAIARTSPLPFFDWRMCFTVSDASLPNRDTIPAKSDSLARSADSLMQAPKNLLAVVDSSGKVAAAGKDTAKTAKKVKAPHDPRKATIRSAIIPGWGQIYNRKYWKVPLVYAALGITGYVFFDNIKTYREVRFAYQVTVGRDTASWDKVAPYLRVFVENNAASSLDNYRREFRRNIDYSVLVFLLFWGLNVVDATVDAHLKEFDVSPELSMKLKPLLPNNTYQLGVGNTTGLSLVFDIHKAKPGRLWVK
ncbi:MAG: DUF5683 domain-containing protein [Flavihumibacter sp.]|jgi:hypothetical protein|nr:DUF5683 domain-containing protein [Flavihumibacter sp.]